MLSYHVIVKEVEKKWKSLKTKYSREKSKVHKRKSGGGVTDMYTSKWMHFRQLTFLEAHVTAKASHSNLEVHLKHTLLINDVLILYVAMCVAICM